MVGSGECVCRGIAVWCGDEADCTGVQCSTVRSAAATQDDTLELPYVTRSLCNPVLRVSVASAAAATRRRVLERI